MYVVRTVSGNNNNMTMSMTTTRYGIVITTIAFITILHCSNASNNNNNMKIHIIRPRNDSLIWGKYLDISIGITHPSPSMLSNLNATICVEINPNEIYGICNSFSFPPNLVDNITPNVSFIDIDSYIPIDIQIEYRKNNIPLKKNLTLTSTLQIHSKELQHDVQTNVAIPSNFKLIGHVDEKDVMAHALVINLERKPRRFFYTNERLQKNNFHNIYQLLGFDGQDEQHDFDSMQIFHGSRGHRAASASHIQAWEHAYKKFQENTSLHIFSIFEDDVLFHEDFHLKLPKYIEQIPSDADIIYMGWMRGALWATEYDEKTQNNIKVQYADADTSIEEGYVIKRHPACLHAYIVTRLGILKMLNNILPLNDAIDLKIASWIFNGKLKGYAFNGKMLRPTNITNIGEDRDRGIIYQDESMGTDIDSFDKVLLLEENRKLRKEINKLRMEIEELRRASGG